MGGIFTFLKWRFGFMKDSDAPFDTVPYAPEYAAPDLARIKNPDPNKIQLTWVGHATFLIQVAGVNILTDPMWSERASPVQWAGPKRYAKPGIRFEDLPKIDVALLSHTHYDHMDRPTILKLGTLVHFIIQARTKWWFANEELINVTELPWGESESFRSIVVTAVPAKHWSKRGFFRTNDAGWGGFIIETPAGTIYFAGDTGYHTEYFKDIGKIFPHIDLALIPIGAYYPRRIFGRFHIDPYEAVIVHKEVGAKKSIGMHWGVFKLTQEPLNEPPLELARKAAAAQLPPEEFTVMKIGETRTL